jgi:hypothetical protein
MPVIVVAVLAIAPIAAFIIPGLRSCRTSQGLARYENREFFLNKLWDWREQEG